MGHYREIAKCYLKVLVRVPRSCLRPLLECRFCGVLRMTVVRKDVD